MKKRKKRIKVKKKKVLIFFIIFFIILTISITFYSVMTYYKNLQRDINNHYNKYLITTKNTILYDKNKKKVGKIYKNLKVSIEKRKDENEKYFKIKNTDYYIYYKDTKKIDMLEKDSKNEHYLIFNKNIETHQKVSLYKEKEKVLELDNGINLPIEFMDKENYTVYYLNNFFTIKKDKNIKEVNKENTKENETKFISVFFYDNINDTCSDYNCITTGNIREHFNKLKENGFYFITLDEYKNYLDNNLRLSNKAILMTTSKENDYVNNLNKELDINIELVNDASGLKFMSTNKKSSKESKKDQIDRYQIKSYSTIENILKMANGEEVIEHEPVKILNNAGGQGIPVLNYHFFYDPNFGETCGEGICLTVQKFREHLEYLKNNNFKTLTMNEFMKWMYGEIELPDKSVLITIDDGAMGTGKHNGNKLIPLLEEYKMHATLFLITGWWDIGNYISPYLDIQSHTNDMHQYGTCGKGQINCYSYDKVIADLQQSINIIGNNDSFCFPFYSYNENSLKAVKDMGFKISFVGGNRKATRRSNKYLIPRYPIHNTITLEKFKNIVN